MSRIYNKKILQVLDEVSEYPDNENLTFGQLMFKYGIIKEDDYSSFSNDENSWCNEENFDSSDLLDRLMINYNNFHGE